jgi:hypothetical protein
MHLLKVHDFLSKQDDIFKHLDKIYDLLFHNNLLDTNCVNRNDKLLSVLDYLLVNSELHLLLRSIKKLETIGQFIVMHSKLLEIFSRNSKWEEKLLARLKE